jgi:hypothetical protein
MPYRPVEFDHRIGGTYYFDLQGERVSKANSYNQWTSKALKIKPLYFSEILVKCYQTSRRYIHLRTHHCENLSGIIKNKLTYYAVF